MDRKKLNGLFSIKKSHLALTTLVLTGLGLGIVTPPAEARDGVVKHGRETGLPLPRFVSLKSPSVNLRVGPGRKYAISWQYKKRGLPMEVIQEFDQWRRVRDSEGATGWVLHSLLSSKRTAIVAPWEKPSVSFGNVSKIKFLNGKERAGRDAATVVRLQAGLMVHVDACEDKWCAVEAQNKRFWLKQETLWGVYPDERVEG